MGGLLPFGQIAQHVAQLRDAASESPGVSCAETAQRGWAASGPRPDFALEALFACRSIFESARAK